MNQKKSFEVFLVTFRALLRMINHSSAQILTVLLHSFLSPLKTWQHAPWFFTGIIYMENVVQSPNSDGANGHFVSLDEIAQNYSHIVCSRIDAFLINFSLKKIYVIAETLAIYTTPQRQTTKLKKLKNYSPSAESAQNPLRSSTLIRVSSTCMACSVCCSEFHVKDI